MLDRAAAPGSYEPIYRRNFPFFMADFIIFAVAMGMIGPSTVIPDFIRRLTDSEILIAFSSQMFDVGWLMPQLLVARQLMRVQNKKWWFVGPNIPVRCVMIIFAGLILLLGEERKGAILAAFLICYGIAAVGDGLVGVPWMDLLGSSLDPKRRARLFGLGTAIPGVIMIGVAQLVRIILSDDGPGFPDNYALLFGIAGTMFVITIPPVMFVRELPGGKVHEETPSLREYWPQLVRVLREDQPFRAMIITRILAGLFLLASPFYIGFATEELHMKNSVAVGNLLMMQTLGNVLGSLLFSWAGDRYLISFIRLALVAAAVHPVMALLAGMVGPAPLYVGFFAVGIMGGSLGLGFINWVISYATHDQRPIYSGLFNSMSAVALLTAPLLGGIIVELFGYRAAFIAALVMILAALFTAVRYLEQPRHATA